MAAKISNTKRIGCLTIVMTVIFVGLVFRLSWIQLVRGEELSRKATDVRASDEIVEPVRGVIYDRNHVELVGNYPVKTIYANPDIFSVRVRLETGENKQEKEKLAKDKVIKQIASILSMDEAQTLSLINSNKPFVILKHKVDYDTCQKLAAILKENRATGIGFIEGTRRSYPWGSLAAHVLGFVGMDPSARGGIERSYDSLLSGTPGRLVAEKDATGLELLQTKTSYNPPVPGKNLILTIDSTIQYYVERELDNLDQTYKPSRSTIIVMDPANGDILAMGSRPTYNPVAYSSYPQSTWDFNPPIHMNYEPGSTFKMFVAAMALEEGTVRETDMLNDPGYSMVLRLGAGTGGGTDYRPLPRGL